MRTAAEWVSYDHVAEAYDTLMPERYALLANDLVAALQLSPGKAVLDVGTGTGAAALSASAVTAPDGVAVGVDPSLVMLGAARAKALSRVAAAQCPGLPFRDDSFDAACGNLVLSHFRSYAAALLDMGRVLKSGGRLAVSAWGAGPPTQFRRLWKEMVLSVIGNEAFQAAVEAAPWEDWFSDAQHMRDALEEAGLRAVDIQTRVYTVTQSIDAYLAMMESSLVGRFMRHSLSLTRWEEFRATSSQSFHRCFQEPLHYTSHALIGVGIKP